MSSYSQKVKELTRLKSLKGFKFKLVYNKQCAFKVC